MASTKYRGAEQRTRSTSSIVVSVFGQSVSQATALITTNRFPSLMADSNLARHTIMANLYVTTKADRTLVLQAVLLATLAERSQVLPHLAIILDQLAASDVGISVRFTSAKGLVRTDKAAVEYLASVHNKEYFFDASYIDPAKKWLEKTASLAGNNFLSLKMPLADLEAFLTLRTCLSGYCMDTADIIIWAALRSNHVAISLIKKSYSNIIRWYSYIEQSNPWILNTVDGVIEPPAKARAAASSTGANYNIDLPDIDGPMVTRFPPEPSGYLHIGHGKAAMMNDYFAHQTPGGTLICRFDDTNPSKESMEFQNAILIKDGKAFADDSVLGKGDESRKNRLPSTRRNLSTERTLDAFDEMKTGSMEGRRWCIRAKIAYDSPNGTLRDPVIYRCNLTPHHRTGRDWKVYPTYDFCAPILDSVEGVTLALRTNEYRDRNAQYEWFQDALGLRKVAIWDFSRLSFIKTVLSKRKLTEIITDGKVWGWDDPRMPTIRGILRRGMAVPALREFIMKQGPSRNILNLEWGALWALNRKYIDPLAPRYTAIAIKDAVRCTISEIHGPEVQTKPKYVKNLNLGTTRMIIDKTILLEQGDAFDLLVGDEITLMNWGNVRVRSITKENPDGPVQLIDFELHLTGDFKSTKKVTWLAATKGNMVPVDLVSFDYLFTKNKLDKGDEIKDYLTDVTEFRTHGYADCNVSGLSKGDIIQFERKGYYILDSDAADDDSRMVFFEIPSPKV